MIGSSPFYFFCLSFLKEFSSQMVNPTKNPMISRVPTVRKIPIPNRSFIMIPSKAFILNLKPGGHQHIFDAGQQSQKNLQRNAEHREEEKHHQVVPDKPQRIVKLSQEDKGNAETDRVIAKE